MQRRGLPIDYHHTITPSYDHSLTEGGPAWMWRPSDRPCKVRESPGSVSREKDMHSVDTRTVVQPEIGVVCLANLVYRSGVVVLVWEMVG